MTGFTKRALFWAAVAFTVAGAARADLALATSKNCMSCHAVERKILGPSFKDVAAKYRGNNGAVDLLAGRIMKGVKSGEGVWGRLAMPASTQVTESEARKLAAWILSTP